MECKVKTTPNYQHLKFEKIGEGFIFIEGPVWNPREKNLTFSDIYGNIMRRWSPKHGVEVIRDPSGKSNGNALDHQGRLVTCEHISRNLTRTEHDGGITTLASHYDGKHLNSPNDVIVKSDGSIYFTDPRSGIESDKAGIIRKPDLDFCGVYRLEPETKKLTLLVEFPKPNGLAFSPDESLLYINDTKMSHIRVFDVKPDGTLANDRLFTDVVSELGAEADKDVAGKPDGMKVDVEGNVYCSGPGPAIYVYNPDATLKGVIASPNGDRTANFAWGDDDWKTLYVCASTELYRVRMDIPGIPSMPV